MLQGASHGRALDDRGCLLRRADGRPPSDVRVRVQDGRLGVANPGGNLVDADALPKRISRATTATGIQCPHRLSRAPGRLRPNRRGGPPHLEGSGEIRDRQESGEAAVVEDEAAVHSLAENSARASIAGSSSTRAGTTSRRIIASRTRRASTRPAARARPSEGEEPDRPPVLEHRIRRVAPGPSDVVHELTETEVGIDGHGLTDHQVAHAETVERLLGRDVAGFGGRCLEQEQPMNASQAPLNAPSTMSMKIPRPMNR